MSRLRAMFFGGTASALLACAGEVVADPQPATSGLTQWVMRAQQRLGLEPEQQRELRALVDDNAGRLDEMRARYSSDTAEARRAQRAAMAGIQEDFRHGLAGILTAAQLAEWDALVEELLGQVHLRQGIRLAETH